MLLCAFEIFVIIAVGVLYICCDNVQNNNDETNQGTEFAISKYTWFNKLTHYIAKLKGELFSRIHSDTCCICCEEIKTEVQSSCGHVFCGKYLYIQLFKFIRVLHCKFLVV